MSIRSALRQHLGAQAAITAIVGSGEAARITPLTIDQGKPRPALTYQRRPKSPHDHNLKGASGSSLATFRLVSWGDTYAQADGLSAAVRDAMQGFSGVVDGTTIDAVTLIDDYDDYIPPVDAKAIGFYAVIFEFHIRYTESIPTFS